MTDLELIIESGDSELDFYLSEVTKEQFILDVKALIKKHTDKKIVKEIIKKLEELI